MTPFQYEASPLDRSRSYLPANIRRTLEESNLSIEVATAIADECETIDRCRRELNQALDDTEKLIREQAETLALLCELNDALVIPGWLQPRVDAVLDRYEPLGASETQFLTAGGKPAAAAKEKK